MREWTRYEQDNNGPAFFAFVKSVLSCWWYWPLMVIYTLERVKKEKDAEAEETLRQVSNYTRK